MSYLEDCLSKRVIFFTGKGGVGKSTMAWSTALACQRRGKKVLVCGWAPASAPPPYAKAAVAPPTSAAAGRPDTIEWVPLETLSAFKEYTLQVIRFERLYNTIFDNRVLRAFVLAAPGLSDTVIAGKIWDLYHKSAADLLVVDLPSSGHAVSFFKSPLGVDQIFKVGFVHKEVKRILQMLSARDVRVDLVATPNELPIVECLQLKEQLEQLHAFRFGYLHVNQLVPELPLPSDSAKDAVPASVRQTLENFASVQQQQQQALSLASELPLPRVRIPRAPTEDWAAALNHVSAVLEEAP